jgi:hypothetical protein
MPLRSGELVLVNQHLLIALESPNVRKYEDQRQGWWKCCSCCDQLLLVGSLNGIGVEHGGVMLHDMLVLSASLKSGIAVLVPILVSTQANEHSALPVGRNGAVSHVYIALSFPRSD